MHLINQYEQQIAMIDQRLSELREALPDMIGTMEKDRLRKRIDVLEIERADLIYAVKRMRREEKKECST